MEKGPSLVIQATNLRAGEWIGASHRHHTQMTAERGSMRVRLPEERELGAERAELRTLVGIEGAPTRAGEDVCRRVPVDRIRDRTAEQPVENAGDHCRYCRVQTLRTSHRLGDVHGVDAELDVARRHELTKGHPRVPRPLDHPIGRYVSNPPQRVADGSSKGRPKLLTAASADLGDDAVADDLGER